MAVRAKDFITLTVVASPTYVRQYFLLQASALAAPSLPTTNPPAAPWTTTEPTYTPDSTDTLYTAMLTAYGSASFAYGPVQKSSSYDAAKQAYNLAFNASGSATAVTNLTNGWKTAGQTTIDGGKIATDSVQAGQIAGDAITAKHTITGATLRTAASGQRVEINSAGLKGYGADGLVKTSIGTDGVLSALGSIKTGTTGQRVEVSSSSAKFFSPYNFSASLEATDNGVGSEPMLQLISGDRSMRVGKFDMPTPGQTVGVSMADAYINTVYADTYRTTLGHLIGGQAWFTASPGATDNAPWHAALVQEVGPTTDSTLAAYASDGTVQAMRINTPGLYQITMSVRLAAAASGRSFVQIGMDGQRHTMRATIPAGEDFMSVSATVRTFAANEFVRTYFYKTNGSLGGNTIRTSITRLAC